MAGVPHKWIKTLELLIWLRFLQGDISQEFFWKESTIR